MEKRNLEIHNFHLHPHGEKGTAVDLKNLNGTDLYELLKLKFVNFINVLPKDKFAKRIIRFNKEIIEGDEEREIKTQFRIRKKLRIVSGKIVTGKYGKTENVVDVDTKDEEPVFTIEDNHAVQKPFYFMICLPENKKDGFLILERDGQFGIKEVFTTTFRKFINANLKKYTIQFSQFVDDEIVKNIVTKGELNSIMLTRHSLPGDIAEKYGLGKFETDDFLIELKIRAKGKNKIVGDAKKKVIQMFDDNPQGFFSFEGFEDIGFANSCTMKVNSTYNNSTRTVDLQDTLKFRPYYEIHIDIDDKGHSAFDSIDSKALDLLEELNIEILETCLQN